MELIYSICTLDLSLPQPHPGEISMNALQVGGMNHEVVMWSRSVDYGNSGLPGVCLDGCLSLFMVQSNVCVKYSLLFGSRETFLWEIHVYLLAMRCILESCLLGYFMGMKISYFFSFILFCYRINFIYKQMNLFKAPPLFLNPLTLFVSFIFMSMQCELSWMCKRAGTLFELNWSSYCHFNSPWYTYFSFSQSEAFVMQFSWI